MTGKMAHSLESTMTKRPSCTLRNSDSAATKPDRMLLGAGLCQSPAAREEKNHFYHINVFEIALELYQ